MIYLHIGYPKTGTTTIQKGVMDNRPLLESQSFYYPHSGIHIYGHHNIYYELAAKEQLVDKLSHRFRPDQGGLQSLQEEMLRIKQNDPEANFILSSEAFFTLKEAYYKELISALSSIDDITAIIVLRRQDYWLRSFWSMEVARMNTGLTFGDWVEERTLPKRANINMTLGRLKKWTPKVRYAVYGFHQFKHAGVLDFFLSECGLSPEVLSQLVHPEPLNESFDYLTLDFMRLMSHRYGSRLSPQLKTSFNGYLRVKAHKFKWGTKFDMRTNNISKETQTFLKAKYAQTNAKVIERYPHVSDSISWDIDDGKKNLLIHRKRIPLHQKMWVESWLLYQMWRAKKK